MEVDDTKHSDPPETFKNDFGMNNLHGKDNEGTVYIKEELDAPEIKFSDTQEFLALGKPMLDKVDTAAPTTSTAVNQELQPINIGTTQIQPVRVKQELMVEFEPLLNDHQETDNITHKPATHHLRMTQAVTCGPSTASTSAKPPVMTQGSDDSDMPNEESEPEIYPVKKQEVAVEFDPLRVKQEPRDTEDFSVEIKVESLPCPDTAASTSTAGENLGKSVIKSNTGKVFECKTCGYLCAARSEMKVHSKIHVGEKKFKCTFCDYRSARSSDLKKHIMNKHTEDKPFKCKVCDYKCVDDAKLTIHVRIHTGERPFKCHICECSYIESSGLINHLKKHSEDKPYKCAVCSYCCRDNQSLKRHKLIHSADKPFKCEECDYRCKEQKQLNIHNRRHTGEKPYKCNICELRFSDYSCHKRHVARHDNFKCKFCDFQFTMFKQLQTHMKTHLAEKPYKCDSCDYQCKDKNSLVKHKRVHTGEFPYECQTCGYKCRDSSNLVKHIINHH